MKKITLLLAFIAVALSGKAQTTQIWKDGVMQASVDKADSLLFVFDTMSREDIEQWTIEHLDSLASVVWQKMQASTSSNKRDPDETREVFRSIGYNGRNVFQYLLGGAKVDEAILDSLIAKANKEGNNKAVIIAGNSGAGKSHAIKENQSVKQLVDKAGVVLDEVWTDRESLKQTLAYLSEHGITDQTVILIYNDAKTSFSNACHRFLSTRRVIGLRFFMGDFLYTQYVGYVDFLEQENIGSQRIYISNAGNLNPSVVTTEEARAWNYSISETEKQELAKYLFDYIYQHKDVISYRDAWAMFYDE